VAEDTSDVRPSDRLDWAALERYLRDHLPSAPGFSRRFGSRTRAPMTVRQFPGGYSNLTYLLRFGDVEIVLRRAPIGPVPAHAHDMAREFRWLAALNPVFPLAPEPFLLCEEPGVIGSVFYAMERRHGVIIRAEEPEALRDRPDLKRGISRALVHTLAGLHAVDASAPAIACLGRPAGFVARQVSGWTERWNRARTSEIAEMDALADWLRGHLPAEERAAVVHGDFKLDNVVLDPRDYSRIIAVLDWEMCALGDPLTDLGMLLVYWIHAPSSSAPPESWSAVTGHPGWLGRNEILECYAAAGHHDLGNIHFYERLALFKLAVILQQLYLRHVRGSTGDARLATLGERVSALARYASALDGA
jgi:aminoglycoside phosphotransferase (APT) family kinase protein